MSGVRFDPPLKVTVTPYTAADAARRDYLDRLADQLRGAAWQLRDAYGLGDLAGQLDAAADAAGRHAREVKT